MNFRRAYNDNEPPIRQIKHDDDTLHGEKIVDLIKDATRCVKMSTLRLALKKVLWYCFKS